MFHMVEPLQYWPFLSYHLGSPPKIECVCLNGGVIAIENGHTHNPLALWAVPVLVHIYIQVSVHIVADPQSVQLRNATTTKSFGFIECCVILGFY